MTSAADVKLTLVTEAPPELGKLFNLDFTKGGGGGLALSAKMLGDALYAYIDKDPATSTGSGCCADTLRKYDKATGAATDLSLDQILNATFAADVKLRHATHTFDVEEEGGVVYAWLMVQYSAADIAALGDAIVCVNAATGEVRKTMDGLSIFSMYDQVHV